jgi:purine-binding chemotaxis protein CheW
MDERARLLARPPDPAEPGDALGVMTFALGTERYAIETQYVREVARLGDISPVPGAPDFLRGVTNLRGEVLCLVDLRTFFDIPATGLTDRSRVVILGMERTELGILVDEAREIARLRPDDIVSPPESVAGVGREYLLGVTREALIVLNGAALLRDPRLYVNQDRSSPEAWASPR